MNKKDDIILDSLRKEFEKSAETVNVPLRLQKESIVAMLKNEQLKQENINKDFSDKTGESTEKPKKNKNYIQQFALAAAMFAVVVAGAVFVNNSTQGNVKLINMSVSQEKAIRLKDISDSGELEKAIGEIIYKNSGQQSGSVPPMQQVQSKPSFEGATGVDPSIPPITLQVTQGNETEKKPADVYDNLIAVNNNSSASDMGVLSANGQLSGITEPVDVNGYEADIVKNEGDYLYVVSVVTNSETGVTSEEIKIVKADTPENIQVVSRIMLTEHSGEDVVDNCIEIHIKNNILIAIASRSNTNLDLTSTMAIFYDVSNPQKPVKVREHIQDGEYVSSTLQGSNLCLVTDKTLADSAKNDSAIPSFSVDGELFGLDATKEIKIVNKPDTSYIFITVTDISDFDSRVGRLAVIGCGKNIYCSSEAVVIVREFVSDEQGKEISKTEICRFNIDGTAITDVGTQLIDGSIVGGVSVDKGNGYLKAATTADDVSNIYVFDTDMNIVSACNYQHEGMKACNTKFIGKNGYIVLIDKNGNEQTVVISFSNPEKPKGECMVTTYGFSDRFYMISDTLAFAVKTEEVYVVKEIYENNNYVNYGAVYIEPQGKAESGDTQIKVGEKEVKTELVTLTLFDLSDPQKPRAVDSYMFRMEDNIKFLPQDSAGIVVISDEDMFGVPVTLYDSETKNESTAYMMFDVSDKSLDKISFFNHSDSVAGSTVSRGVCIDDVLYTVSGDKIVAFSIKEGKMISSTEE